MRPGRLQDLPGLRALWAHELVIRGRDAVPSEAMIARLMSTFDWEARSRVIDDGGRRLRAAVLVMEQASRGVTVTRVETAARDSRDRLRLIRWGLGLSRAAGAAVAQVWRPAGHREDMADLGLRFVRPFWRMDRRNLEGVPLFPPPSGYRLARAVDRRAAIDVFNRSFAEHWRFQALDPRSLPLANRPADLELLAETDDRKPAAIVWCSVETYDPDPRLQPVGLVEVVGTLPDHRRRGLASALTAQALQRLKRHGALSASLYVDALNPTRAYDLYRRLGFTVAFEYEVFETT
jgi:ribosomal protein S18 acetylase RimI-like enzyme